MDEYKEEIDFELPSAPKGSTFYKTDKQKSESQLQMEEDDFINLYSISNREYAYKIINKLIEEKNKDIIENDENEELEDKLPIDDLNQFPSLISNSPSSAMFSTKFKDDQEKEDQEDQDEEDD